MPFINGEWITELDPSVLARPEVFGIPGATVAPQTRATPVAQLTAGDDLGGIGGAAQMGYNGIAALPDEGALGFAGLNGFGALPAVNGEAMPITTLPGSQPTHGDVVPGLLGTIVDGVPISGPGVPEPPHQMVAKEWHLRVQSKEWGSFYMFYWRLVDGRCMSYHSPTKTWKIWKPKKHIVISANPRLKNLAKLDRVHKRMVKMVKRYAPPAPRKGKPVYQQPYLSPMERKLLKGGS